MANLVEDGTLRIVLTAIDAAAPASIKASVLAERTALPLRTVVAAVKELLRRDLVEIVPADSIEIHVAAKE